MTRYTKAAWFVAGAVLAAFAVACTSHHVSVDPIEVKPIHLTVDVNLKVQRELESFFDFEKDRSAPESKPERDTTSVQPGGDSK